MLPPRVPGRHRSYRLRADVTEDDARCVVALAEDGDEVGMAAAGVARDLDAPTGWELYSINVQDMDRGSGAADALLVAVLGKRDTTLWVLSGNGRAQSFYRRHGFVADGGQSRHEGSGAMQIRMVRQRTASAT
ncbi:MAG: GNAT family N-acetyltransferase [Actinomycetota bacterium]|nr:GNAT family N-acetyltransferase [Actinomycetota bacterium]